MNDSFQLQSSMSPKLNKMNRASPKQPSKLALKKYFRRSSIVGKTDFYQKKKNESIISIYSSDSDVVIIKSDEESPEIRKKPTAQYLSTERKKSIEQWLSALEPAKQNLSLFSNLSKVVGDEGCGPTTGTPAASSTFLEPSSKGFHELFRRQPGQELLGTPQTPPDLYAVKNLNLDDPKLCKKAAVEPSDSLEASPSDEIDVKSCADILDSIYGTTWRANADKILPVSEPRVKQTERKTTRVPKTERILKKPNAFEAPSSLLKTLQEKRYQKGLVSSPFTKTQQRLGSVSDTESDSDTNAQQPLMKQLDFNDSDSSSSYSARKPLFPRKPKARAFESPSSVMKRVEENRYQNALASPWMKTLKRICDSDTESDSGANAQQPLMKPPDLNDSDSGSFASSSPEPLKVTKTAVKEPPRGAKLSFLASLSKNVPDSRCDVSALIYRATFKQHKEELAEKLFALFNETVFNKQIPADTVLVWNDRMRKTSGTCTCSKVVRRNGLVERRVKVTLASKVIDSADRLRDTLIHELCHAATWIVNEVSDGHGNLWKAWAFKAMKTFPELPPIKRCHQYALNTKYTYRCVKCGQCIGRHTKSLNTERKRCGVCYSEFELLVNKTNKDGEKKSVPVIPKKATGFALFVKENYSNFKQNDLAHKDVMKVLGQKFAELKAGNCN